MSLNIDISGKKFGKLTAIKKVGSKDTHALWRVGCECNKVIFVTYSNLVSGNTTQCSFCYYSSLRKLSDEDIKKMKKLKEEGASYTKIAKEFNISRSTAFRNINNKNKTVSHNYIDPAS